MSFFSQFPPLFWLLFSILVSIAVLRELRRPGEDSDWLRKKRERI